MRCFAIARFVAISLPIFAIAGCTDKAAHDYALCLQYELNGDIGPAWDACTAAMNAAPTSKAGEKAIAKLIEIKPKYDVWKTAYDKKVAKEQATAEREEKLRRKRHLRELEDKISMSYTGANDSCRNHGLPPYEAHITGGTFSENREYADFKGCIREPLYDNYFCCP